MKEKIKDYIKIYESVISESDCNFILNEYINSKEWSLSRVSYNNTQNTNEDLDIRNCDMIEISQLLVLQKNFNIRKKIDTIIFEHINKTLLLYHQEFSFCSVSGDCGYTLLRYNKGQFFKTHIDQIQGSRELSCSIILNDNYEGGEFCFLKGEIEVKPPKGSIIIFPSNFMFPHEIKTIRSGYRYSIITWFF